MSIRFAHGQLLNRRAKNVNADFMLHCRMKQLTDCSRIEIL
jgi:hypothetical protein